MIGLIVFVNDAIKDHGGTVLLWPNEIYVTYTFDFFQFFLFFISLHFVKLLLIINNRYC